MNAASIINGPFHIPLDLIDDAEVGDLSPRLAVFQIFDAFADSQIGYGHASLFEAHQPGALTALYAWAAARSIAVETTDVKPDMRVHRVTLPSRAFFEVYARKEVTP